MFSADILLRALLYTAVLVVTLSVHQAYAEPADSDFCTIGIKPKPNDPNPSFASRYQRDKSYYQHNAITMASDFNKVLDYFKFDRKSGGRNADAVVRQLEESDAASSRLVARRAYRIVIEPPEFVHFSGSCERMSKTNMPLVPGEYPIILNSYSPRVIGEMCAEEPVIRFDSIRNQLRLQGNATLQMEDFYDPAYSSDNPFSYEKLESKADRNELLPAFIRGLMGVRMAQCGDLPASMTLVAESETEGTPVMTASLLFNDHGIQILTRDDATAQRIVADHARAKERFAAKYNRSSNWEEHAAVGAAIIISGLAIMAMSRCNDKGDFGNTSLPDCE